MTVVAIMQPTFLPWLGYFALMDQVDHFVLLDDVQFSYRSFQRRNRIKTAHGPLTLTVPCKNGKYPIRDVEIAVPPQKLQKKIMRSISQSYAKAPHKTKIISVLERVFEQDHKKLCHINSTLIQEIAILLEIDTNLYFASKLDIAKMDKSIRLVKICEKFHADQYLSAPGSFAYLKDFNPFESSPIELRFFSFSHPVYSQLHGTFEPHLSVIDAMINVGLEKTKELISSGVGPSLDFKEMQNLQTIG